LSVESLNRSPQSLNSFARCAGDFFAAGSIGTCALAKVLASNKTKSARFNPSRLRVKKRPLQLPA